MPIWSGLPQEPKKIVMDFSRGYSSIDNVFHPLEDRTKIYDLFTRIDALRDEKKCKRTIQLARLCEYGFRNEPMCETKTVLEIEPPHSNNKSKIKPVQYSIVITYPREIPYDEDVTLVQKKQRRRVAGKNELWEWFETADFKPHPDDQLIENVDAWINYIESLFAAVNEITEVWMTWLCNSKSVREKFALFPQWRSVLPPHRTYRVESWEDGDGKKYPRWGGLLETTLFSRSHYITCAAERPPLGAVVFFNSPKQARQRRSRTTKKRKARRRQCFNA
tara:strand:- start:145 stop:975 length:831 start_codon:yes stop_codon:yes gene_type:complete